MFCRFLAFLGSEKQSQSFDFAQDKFIIVSSAVCCLLCKGKKQKSIINTRTIFNRCKSVSKDPSTTLRARFLRKSVI